MSFPPFFDDIPPIVVHDRLAEFLGAAEGGIIEYRYADAVKLAGHSCPTVAGAYLLTRRALAALYPDVLPERGDVQVEFRNAQENGVTGVTGAAALSSALIRLNRENASNLWPHPLYSFWYYSHPTLGERLAAIRKEAP